MTAQLLCFPAPLSLEQEDQVIQLAMQILDQRFADGPYLTKPCQVANYLKVRLAPQEHEVFSVVFLDAKHRVLSFEIMFHGSISASAVYPREVVKRALANNAAAVILAHNHPSGETEPSNSDVVLTRRLKEALSLVDVVVLDHFIVGHGTPYSMAEHGRMY